MFVITLTYVKPLPEIDRLMDQHVAFLETQFKKGTFMAAGRQNPRVGGVILARDMSRAAVQSLMETDPFVATGAATFDVVEFRTSLHHPRFKEWADKGTRTVG